MHYFSAIWRGVLFPYGLLALHINKNKPATPLARGWQALPTIYLKLYLDLFSKVAQQGC